MQIIDVLLFSYLIKLYGNDTLTLKTVICGNNYLEVELVGGIEHLGLRQCKTMKIYQENISEVGIRNTALCKTVE